MPVGTGSIKRAAAKKTAADKMGKERESTEQTAVESAETDRGRTTAAVRGKRAERKAWQDKDTATGSCQITQELPVHLL